MKQSERRIIWIKFKTTKYFNSCLSYDYGLLFEHELFCFEVKGFVFVECGLNFGKELESEEEVGIIM